MKPNPFTTDRLPDFTRTLAEVTNGDRIKDLEQYINMLESVLLSIAEEAECDAGELIEAYRMTPARAEILKNERKKARKTQNDTASSEFMSPRQTKDFDRATRRQDRISLIKLKSKPMKKRSFDNHPDLKYSPDEQTNRRHLSDKSLNVDLKKARKAEKKK